MSNIPKILQAHSNVMNVDLRPILYVDPAQFPEGLDITVLVPGGLQPLGMMRVPRGVLVMAAPPEVSQHLVAHMRKAVAEAQQSADSVRPPGL